jgi:hypothetical protein
MSFSKLLRMSSEELLYRSKAVVGRWHEECRFKLGLPAGNGMCLSELSVTESKCKQLWAGSVDYTPIAQKLCSEHPGYLSEIRAAADAICKRQFTLLGVPVQYPSGLSWIADPLSGKDWPMRFHTRIKIFGGDREHGDVKYVWELNRHQFLTTLGKAYRLSGDHRYASAAVELMQDWIRGNPYKVGVNWTSALEVAIRSLSWCQVLEFIHDSSALNSDKRQIILRSLYQHGHYIDKHLSFFFSPYNHLIGEAAALYIVGSLLSWLKPARGWKDKGWAILEREMPNQFHADGGTVEQAISYHHFTLGFYLHGFLLRRRLGLEIPSGMESLLEKAFEFSMYMTRPDGLVPMIGDGDEGKAIDLLQNSIWDFRPLLAIGAALFQREDFKAMAGPFPPDAAWLLGIEGWKKYESLRDRTPKEDSKVLRESGYCIMRTGWDHQSHYLNFDCGEIAAGVPKGDIPSAAHGHADALSIEVAAYGVPVLVDPGFYTYNGNEQWHRYFRETDAHNTVVVDGCSQAEYRGRLKWSHAPDTKLHHAIVTKMFDYAESSHDGYSRLIRPVVHRRAVVFLKPDYWLIRDELWGEGEHRIDRYFHFADVEIFCDEHRKLVHTRFPQGNNLAVLSIEKGNTEIEIIRGGNEPKSGWIAPGYGKKLRAPVARYSTVAHLPIALSTLIVPFKEGVPELEVEVIQLPESDSVSDQGFVVEVGDKRDILFFSARKDRAAREFRSDRWLTDGRLSSVRLDKNGNIVSCAMVAGSELNVDGTVLLQAGHKIPFAALCFEDGRAIMEKPNTVEVLTSLF